ncbi:lysosome membrane protein 2 [Stomoxys calcitrans]|uniref:Scavenger receptor class B member 1 n=1 Tax=Stomoxys calcitrans TaxID=35570 RepID=A0A1I8QBI7_STOCA|nr:lysosome membrane protein 2 [Stomoxys calcitrans]XP_059224668.1 lysosome membrane protein 2 [Stomoxys calcitrans]XP_059224669.1 lysosome membrane protein 2 [Stomoxys calcitrans]XP_059224670.1 lysosome membrane protein 2 [Stomoxys calcitrans]XP_059224671.1 lysosome membrane protein 2 [Stomoxys calcitrans]
MAHKTEENQSNDNKYDTTFAADASVDQPPTTNTTTEAEYYEDDDDVAEVYKNEKADKELTNNHSANYCKENGKGNGNIVKYNRSDSGKKTQSLFEIVYEIIREKEQRTKEMGTLILLGGMTILFLMSLTGLFVMWFTQYYNNKMLENLILAKDSETAKSWINPNPKYDTLLKVHIFNYTNIHDYLHYKADKIKVEDLGPLIYKEHTTKVNVVYNDNHTVTFRDHRSYQFLRNRSTHDENVKILVPNVPFLAASVQVDKMNSFKRRFSISAIRSASGNPFYTLKARDYLWGYKDPILSMKNTFSSGDSRFGLLKNRNGTSVDSLQINTGEDDIRKFSTITQFNGKPLLDYWTDDECNRIDGSDPSMFPPHVVETREPLNVFLQVLCRKIPLQFEKEVTIYDNIDALRYRTPLNVFSRPEENPNNQCYCQNTTRCMPSGVINATKCYDDAPIYPSFPHFFSGDPAIYKDFEGIEPKQEIHQTYADVHPRFAFPISGASRIQINLALHKGELVRDKVKRFADGTILPLIWIEITSGDFTPEVIDTLYASTFGLNLIEYSLKYGTLLMSIVSFSLIVAGFYYLAKRRELTNDKILSAELRALSVDLSPMALSQLQQQQQHA